MTVVQLSGGIGRRTALIFALPLLLTTLALGFHFTGRYMDDTREALQDRGSLMVKHLAALCEFGMYSEDISELRKQAASIMRESDVIAVEISNTSNDLLVQLGNPAGSLAADNDRLVFNAAILRTGVPVQDFDTDTGTPVNNSTPNSIGSVQVVLSTRNMQQVRKSILATGMTLTGGGLLLSMLLAYIVSRSVADPIVRLTGVVRELTGGNLLARAGTGSPGELGTLEQGINQMASSLEDAQHRLQRRVDQATAKLQLTVSTLEASNRKLEQARAEAVAAGAAKSEFLARMSHEIRTPLSAVIGFSGLLQESKLDENQQEHLRTITQAASQLLQIIDDILGYTRLDSNTMTLEAVSFNLHEALENVVSMFSAQAHEKKLELVLYIHSEVPQFVISDPNRITQVLTNLVNNAIKFTEHGHVVVEVAIPERAGSDSLISFMVTDTGIGLSESQLQVIFDPFIQADVSTSRKYGGTGLGLSICRKLVNLLGGTIDVKSSPGNGSSFRFTVTAPADHHATGYQAPVLTGRKVVVYDRNPFMLRALRNRFFNWGAMVFNTSDRARLCSILAADAAEENPCDLLIMGLAHDEFESVPEQDWLSDVRMHCAAPVIVLLGTDRYESSTSSQQTGVCLLPKPPRSERLLRTVRSCLGLTEQAAVSRPAIEAAATSRESGLAGLQLLLAEDNPFNQQLFRQLLDSHGIVVTLAENGEQACALAGQREFDLVFMDIHMPVMGGIEAAQRIRTGLNRATPIIALTADVFVVEDDYQDSAPINDILYKPVSGAALVSMIRKWYPKPASVRPVRTDTSAEFTMPPEFRVQLRLEMGRLVQEIRTAVAGHDWPQAAKHVHQLKGVTGYAEAPELDARIRELQAASREQDLAMMLATLDWLDEFTQGMT